MTAAGLVLAAGEGRRLGRPKALVALAGELLVDRAVRLLREAGCDPVVVVLGAAAEEVRAQASTLDGCVVVENPDWPAGMGSSLRRGLEAVVATGASRAAVTVVDLPTLTAAVLRRLLAADSARPAVVASYAGQRRNPAVLDASIWAEVAAAATGDTGARAWMQAHPDQVHAVACDDLASDVDIDTPEDLRRLAEETT